MCIDYKWLWIEWKCGNNKFSYEKRIDPKIRVAPLKHWDINDLKIWNEIVFEEIQNNKLISCFGLKNFIKIKNKDIYIFDNHNHALYFRYIENMKWNIKDKIDLIHIDQHSDMNTPDSLPDIINQKNIYKYVNYNINVWNFIEPAIKINIVWRIIPILSEYKLLDYDISNSDEFILDIDIDFWDKKMSINKHNETIKKVQELIKKAKIITIATSPFFIDQKKAIKIIKEILS